MASPNANKSANKAAKGATCVATQVPLLITLLSMVAKAAAKFVEDKVSFSNADKTRTAFVPPSPAKFNRCYVIYNTRIPKKIDPQIAGGQYINEGGYGKLYYVDMPECDAGATLTGATRPLAVKVVNAPPGLSPEKAYEYVHKEIINYVELQGNPGMVKLYCATIEETKDYQFNAATGTWIDVGICRGALVMERAACSLADDTGFAPTEPLSDRVRRLLQLLVTWFAFHYFGNGKDCCITDHDCKPGNNLLLPTGDFVICDGGDNMRFVRHGKYNTCALSSGAPCTPGYTPPETDAKAWQGSAAHTYAMGLTLFALLNGNGNSGWPAALLYLHQGLFTGEMLRVLKALGLNCIEENLRQQGIPEGLIRLILAMSHPDPRQRPTFIEIFQLAGALGLFDQQDWQHVVQAVVPQMRTAAALAMSVWRDGQKQAAENPGSVMTTSASWAKWNVDETFGAAIADQQAAYTKAAFNELRILADKAFSLQRCVTKLKSEHAATLQDCLAKQRAMIADGDAVGAKIMQQDIDAAIKAYAFQQQALQKRASSDSYVLAFHAAGLVQRYRAQAAAAHELRASGAAVELRPAQLPPKWLALLERHTRAEEQAAAAPAAAPAEATPAEAAVVVVEAITAQSAAPEAEASDASAAAPDPMASAAPEVEASASHPAATAPEASAAQSAAPALKASAAKSAAPAPKAPVASPHEPCPTKEQPPTRIPQHPADLPASGKDAKRPAVPAAVQKIVTPAAWTRPVAPAGPPTRIPSFKLFDSPPLIAPLAAAPRKPVAPATPPKISAVKRAATPAKAAMRKAAAAPPDSPERSKSGPSPARKPAARNAPGLANYARYVPAPAPKPAPKPAAGKLTRRISDASGNSKGNGGAACAKAPQAPVTPQKKPSFWRP